MAALCTADACFAVGIFYQVVVSYIPDTAHEDDEGYPVGYLAETDAEIGEVTSFFIASLALRIVMMLGPGVCIMCSTCKTYVKADTDEPNIMA